jgi:GTP-binding protein HflX
MIEAWNKVDLLGPDESASIAAEAARKPDVVPISAQSGEGVDLLVRTAAERLREGSKLRQFSLPSGAGEAMAWLHANGEVVDQQADEVETAYQVRLSDADWARFQTRYLPAA